MNTDGLNIGRQRGLGLIEVLIGMVIALFLLAGLASIFSAMLQSSQTRNALSDLQERELLAATILSKTIQQSGYYPDPVLNTSAVALPAQGNFAAAQGIFGDAQTVTSRFLAPANDLNGAVINCQGGNNSTTNSVIYNNAFSVAGGALQCALNGAAPQPLVDGVASMHLLYGVNTNAGTPNDTRSVTQYTATVPAAGWNNVLNVRATLCFANPVRNTNVAARAPCAANEIPFSFFVNLIGQGQT
jgi:type IV pilus assembly protein PilW